MLPSRLRVFVVQNLFCSKVAFSGFLLGNREKIAVVANDVFSRRAGNMAEKMNRQAPTSNIQRDSKLQNAFGALVIGDSLVLGGWVLDAARKAHALPFCHSACPKNLRGQNNPRSFAPICGSNPVFKIKELSQKIKNRSSNPIKVLLMKKIPNFFRALLREIIGKSCKNRRKNPSKKREKPAIYERFSAAPICP